jgi:hypothetical protein
LNPQKTPGIRQEELDWKKNMNFKEFTKLVESFEKPVILLEGSRNVLDEDAAFLVELAAKLAKRFPQALFRSGGASGSDDLFAQGVSRVNREKMQLVLPKALKSFPDETNTIFFGDLPASEQEEIFTMTAQATPAYRGLIDFYKKKKPGRAFYKTQYLLRDALKVCGSETLRMHRADVGCFYVNSDKPGGGGTGHTIRVCELLKTPVIEQTKWFKWL